MHCKGIELQHRKRVNALATHCCARESSRAVWAMAASWSSLICSSRALGVSCRNSWFLSRFVSKWFWSVVVVWNIILRVKAGTLMINKTQDRKEPLVYMMNLWLKTILSMTNKLLTKLIRSINNFFNNAQENDKMVKLNARTFQF